MEVLLALIHPLRLQPNVLCLILTINKDNIVSYLFSPTYRLKKKKEVKYGSKLNVET